jgi:hypothetical protein
VQKVNFWIPKILLSAAQKLQAEARQIPNGKKQF